jgi:hypothetical protein
MVPRSTHTVPLFVTGTLIVADTADDEPLNEIVPPASFTTEPLSCDHTPVASLNDNVPAFSITEPPNNPVHVNGPAPLQPWQKPPSTVPRFTNRTPPANVLQYPTVNREPAGTTTEPDPDNAPFNAIDDAPKLNDPDDTFTT